MPLLNSNCGNSHLSHLKLLPKHLPEPVHFTAWGKTGGFYAYLKALGSEKEIQSCRVVWGALSVEILLLPLVEALLDVGTLFHSVVSVKPGSVTGEIFSYLHQGSQTTSSILQISGLP